MLQRRQAKQLALLKAIGSAGLYRLVAGKLIDLRAYADELAADTSLTDNRVLARRMAGRTKPCRSPTAT